MVNVRWPTGLHLRAGSIPAMGSASYRTDTIGPEEYWRQNVALLLASTPRAVVPAPSVINNQPPPLQPVVTQVTVMAGPQGIGERWDVTMVQVQTSSQLGLPPLVIQQVLAQQAGTGTTPPPPIVARVHRAVGGQPIDTLAVTSQGGYDTVGVSCPTLAAGEQIMVVWYGAATGDTVQAIIKGTKYALST